MGLRGYQQYEKNCFLSDCVVKCTYKSFQSAYYTVTYKDQSIRFCVSDHHGVYRGSLLTVISKSRKEKKIKNIAWDIYQDLKKIKYKSYR